MPAASAVAWVPWFRYDGSGKILHVFGAGDVDESAGETEAARTVTEDDVTFLRKLRRGYDVLELVDRPGIYEDDRRQRFARRDMLRLKDVARDGGSVRGLKDHARIPGETAVVFGFEGRFDVGLADRSPRVAGRYVVHRRARGIYEKGAQGCGFRAVRISAFFAAFRGHDLRGHAGGAFAQGLDLRTPSAILLVSAFFFEILARR